MQQNDSLASWLGEQRVFGWQLNTPEHSAAYLMRDISTDGITQAQEYAERAAVVAQQYGVAALLKLYVNNSGVGIMLYAEAGASVPEQYYDIADSINKVIV